MTRTTPTTIAALLVTALGIFGLIDATRILAAGTAGLEPLPGMESAGAPPFGAGLLFMVIAVACFFGAFGLWKNQRWGKVVSITAAAVYGLFALGDLLGTVLAQQYVLAAISALIVGVCLTIVVLVLRGRAAVQAG